MKICAICDTRSSRATCPACGEASWLSAPVSGRGLRADVVIKDDVADVNLVLSGDESPKPSRKSRKRRSAE